MVRIVRPTRKPVLFLFTLFFLMIPVRGFARTYDDYRADYPKGAFCSAIAGACASDDDLENAFFQNPAALTSKGPSWDFDFDFRSSSSLEPGVKKSKDISEQNFLGGLGWSSGSWGVGFSLTGRKTAVAGTTAVKTDNGGRQVFSTLTRASSVQVNLPVSYRWSPRLSLGASILAVTYHETLEANGSPGTLFNSSHERPSIGFSVGFIEKLDENWKVGSWLRSSIVNRTLLKTDSDAVSPPIHSQEEFLVHDPWIVATGVSFTPWSDLKTFLLDLDVIGNTPGGDLLSYYAPQSGGNISPKGRRVTFEPRLGYRMPYAYEAKGMIYTGIYYEPSRREEFNGRLHFTGGLSYHALSWLELMAGADVSRDFFQFFLTFR